MRRFRGAWSLGYDDDTKSLFISHFKAQLKNDISSRHLNSATLSDSRTALERAFYTVGANTLKARFPIAVRVGGMTVWCCRNTQLLNIFCIHKLQNLLSTCC